VMDDAGQSSRSPSCSCSRRNSVAKNSSELFRSRTAANHPVRFEPARQRAVAVANGDCSPDCPYVCATRKREPRQHGQTLRGQKHRRVNSGGRAGVSAPDCSLMGRSPVGPESASWRFSWRQSSARCRAAGMHGELHRRLCERAMVFAPGSKKLNENAGNS